MGTLARGFYLLPHQGLPKGRPLEHQSSGRGDALYILAAAVSIQTHKTWTFRIVAQLTMRFELDWHFFPS